MRSYYFKEAELMHVIGYDVFRTSIVSVSAGLWAYGYTTYPKSPDLSMIHTKYGEFKEELNKMKSVEISDPLSTTRQDVQFESQFSVDS